MTPHSFVYLDYYQSIYNEPLAIGGMLDMKKVYSIDIMPPAIEEERRRHIIGAQANVWTEYMPDSRHVEYMVFPRLAALAEALWTSEASLDYDDFTERMNAQYARYDAMDIAYRVPYPEGAKPDNVFTDDSVTITLDNSISSSHIFYTLDGTTPDGRSDLYTGPIALSLEKDRTLKAVTVMSGGRRSEVMSALLRKEAMRNPVAADNIAPGVLFNIFIGDFSSAYDLPAKADSTGVVETIKIPPGAPAVSFGLEFKGFIEVEADGIYTFYCSSDDGILLYIDGDLIVDGDKVHHGVVNEGQAALKAGLHDIRVLYFQRLYRQSLSVSYEGPGIPRQPLQVTYAPDNLSMAGVR
jgi:hexosaminidase